MTIRKTYQFIFTVALAAAALLLAKPAQANSITFQLDNNSTQWVDSGGTVSFYATVIAPVENTATIYLNSYDSGGYGPLTLNGDGFWNNFEPLSIDPGQSYDYLLFTVTVPFGTHGAYNGYFTLNGGSDFFTNDPLASASFEVDVLTPEPGSIWLFSIGLVALAFVAGRKRFQTNE